MFRPIIALTLMTEPIIIGATGEIRIRTRGKEERETIKKFLGLVEKGGLLFAKGYSTR